MTDNPIAILAILGACLLGLSIVGRIEAEKINVGISQTKSRIIAGVFGVLCLVASIYLQNVNHKTDSGSTPSQSANLRKSVTGSWRCKTEGRLVIDWLLEATTEEGNVSFAGRKSMVDGKLADEFERLTSLRIDGVLDGLVLRGRYSETGRASTFTGMVEIIFKADLHAFEGSIYQPDGKVGSKFYGFRLE